MPQNQCEWPERSSELLTKLCHDIEPELIEGIICRQDLQGMQVSQDLKFGPQTEKADQKKAYQYKALLHQTHLSSELSSRRCPGHVSFNDATLTSS